MILGIGLLGLVLPSIRLCGGDGWIRTTALFRGQIYSLVQSTTLPRLQNLLYRNTLLGIQPKSGNRYDAVNVFAYGTRYENRTRLSALKGQRPNR